MLGLSSHPGPAPTHPRHRTTISDRLQAPRERVRRVAMRHAVPVSVRDITLDMAEIMRVRTVLSGVPGTPYYSNLYFVGAPGGADAQDCLDNVAAFFNSLESTMISTCTWQSEGDVALIDPATGTLVGNASGTPGSGVGTVSGDPMPWANQGLLRLLTNTYVGGRRLRGRFFNPAQVEANSTLGVPIGAYVTGLNTIGTALITASAADSAEWIVWSRANGTYGVITSVDTWGQWAVLRSRRD